MQHWRTPRNTERLVAGATSFMRNISMKICMVSIIKDANPIRFAHQEDTQ